tara:strand:- start:2272 stop:2841 length:570 start_codon:yes stop_codon:yes gene_type:complete
MGKNAEATECNKCGELVYYGGICPCSREEWLEQLETARNDIIPMLQNNWIEEFNTWGDDAIHSQTWHYSIWFASTKMLPGLEVQVVIDSNNRAHISSGSAGYVSFLKEPKKMKLPVKCWFHTHPFGSAYFSGTDWNTVNTWNLVMEKAYVIGGDEHYGFWENTKPNELEIREKDGTYRTQQQIKGEEEE